MNKENMYVVIKREDALQYLTEIELQSLEHLLLTIEQGRASDGEKSFNIYYVCNVDEPYAQVVHGVIIGGEATKTNNNNTTYCPDACGTSCSECFSDSKVEHYKECTLYMNKLCACEEDGYCYDTEDGCEYIRSFTEEHGYLIDYDTKWFGKLEASPHTEKYGWRVYFKDGTFNGILDEQKVAIWSVDESTLRQDI